MSYSEPARRAARRILSTILAATIVACAALTALVLLPINILHGDPEPVVTVIAPGPLAMVEPGQDDEHERGGLGAPAGPPGMADGAIPYGVTLFDDDTPAVANLNPDLLRALRQAATDAASDGVEFYINSGWRSPEYQEQLLREAIATYGSEEEAARWVATVETSAHVSGDAVDIAPVDAMVWLSEHGAAYGLCRIYSNEPWHFELRPEAPEHGCPPMYADPAHGPGR